MQFESVDVEAVEFEGAGGLTLRGRLYLPTTSAPAAAVVMVHGFSAVKEMGLPPYAELFAEAGFAVLLYDHRNLGESDGEPRQEINPWAQCRDLRHALSWLADRNEVDENRLALWGSSFAGGEVLLVGAIDERVRAVIASAPFAGIDGVDYSDTSSRFEAMKRCILDDSGSGLADSHEEVFGPVPVVQGDGAYLPQPESVAWFLAAGPPTGTWRNEVTVVNAFGLDPMFDPGVAANHLAGTASLFVVADNDTVSGTDPALAAYERATGPKQLHVFAGHHFSAYSGDVQHEAATVEVEFLTEHLRP